jgi:hypothetical protein
VKGIGKTDRSGRGNELEASSNDRKIAGSMSLPKKLYVKWHNTQYNTQYKEIIVNNIILFYNTQY